MRKNLISAFSNLIIAALGFLCLLAPFIFPQARNASTSNTTFPIFISLIIGLCVLILLYSAQASILDNKIIAVLGVLIAINSGLRFLENAIPGPAGFSPTFFLIILTGYFFGGHIGFLMGSMTLFVSALITGGVGPWLPGQMITAGWVGQSAALLSYPIQKIGWRNKSGEIILLAVLGVVWGMLYGVIMNLWFWPFIGAAPGQSWSQSASLLSNIQRYLVYYLTTSVIWDITRSIGNVLMMVFMAKPVLVIFKRFQQRFSYQIERQLDS